MNSLRLAHPISRAKIKECREGRAQGPTIQLNGGHVADYPLPNPPYFCL